MSPHDDDLETLLADLAPTPEARAALLEEHRLLEHDLSRLADPLPPPDFVQAVMARVDAEPARAPARGEVWGGALVAGVAIAGWVGAVLAGGGKGALLPGVVQGLVRARDAFVGLLSGASAVWRLAPVPVAVALTLAAVAAVMLVRRVDALPAGRRTS